jgi:tetratricopeptide (TPR) repeat protein
MNAVSRSASDLLREARELDARGEYPSLRALLDSVPDALLETEPELAYLGAEVRRRTGETGAAAEWLGRLAAVGARRGNDRLNRRRLNLLGVLHFDRGEVVEAEEAWLELLDASTRAGDEEFVARSCNNLGVVHTLNLHEEEALAAYARATAAYQRLGYRRGLAQSHHNLGIIYREMGLLDRAQGHFHEAAAHARADGRSDEVARVEQERALLHLLQADPALARATAIRARERYRSLGDRVGVAETERVVGLALLVQGAVDDARTALEASAEVARDTGAALLEAEVLEALAGVALRQGDRREARRLRIRATLRFRSIGALAWGRRARYRVEAIVALPGPGGGPPLH